MEDRLAEVFRGSRWKIDLLGHFGEADERSIYWGTSEKRMKDRFAGGHFGEADERSICWGISEKYEDRIARWFREVKNFT